VIGTNIVVEAPRWPESNLSFQGRGRFSAISCWADEINRATPKTQSALLEAMQEHFGHSRRPNAQAEASRSS